MDIYRRALQIRPDYADADFRASVCRQIEETSDALFKDVEAVRQYERIFERLVEHSR